MISFQNLYYKLLTFIEILIQYFTNRLKLTRFGPKKYKSDKRLDGKVVIITGANTGIGKQTAKDLAKRGAKVIIACRNVEKANEAVNSMKRENENCNFKVIKLDLSSLTSVRQFAKQVCEQESKIDILINNAGIMMCPKLKSEDGFEMQFATNYLGETELDTKLDYIYQSNHVNEPLDDYGQEFIVSGPFND